MPRVTASQVVDLDLGEAAADPWAELDVTVTSPAGDEVVVPGFVSGRRWRFRYSSEKTGVHRFRTRPDLAEGEIEVTPRPADAEGLERGAISVGEDGRRFRHADGTPFLWTGDTWWHGFVNEKIGDDEFRELAGRRAAEGFSVVQLVVLPPEAEMFGAAVRCRAGWAWTEDLSGLNLAWWDDADGRIQTLVESGLVPCILGSWGYHLDDLDDRGAVRMWREMVARWAAYPVVWGLAGEPRLVFGSRSAARMEADRPGLPRSEGSARPITLDEMYVRMTPYNAGQMARLGVVARALRALDPFRRPVTTHTVPGEMVWQLVEESTLDFWMLQTGHGGHPDIATAVDDVETAYSHTPVKPVVNGEASYEGIAGSSWADVQRMLFWSNVLAGAAGFSYGGWGLTLMNTPEFPGLLSGKAALWQEASRFDGGRQVGASSRWLRSVDWATLTPAHHLTDPHQRPGDRYEPYTAVFGNGARLVYLPRMNMHGTYLWTLDVRFHELGGRPWTGRFVDPRTGEEHTEFDIVPADGDTGFLTADRPSWEDWLILLRPS